MSATTTTPSTASPLPERHKRFEEARRWSPLARRILGKNAALSRERWTFIGEQLLEADPHADALVTWMQAHGMREARPLVDRLLRHGPDALDETPIHDASALLRFIDHVEHTPDWVNFDLIERGGRFLDSTHPAPYYVLRDMALLAGYTWSDLNHPLILTGALRSGATQRVTRTMSWFSDTVHPHALRPHHEGYRATLQVRILHATVRRHLLAREDWHVAEHGVPINQTDMAATWLAFSALLLLGLRLLGVPVSRDDAHAVMHLWKYACWLMGVDLTWLTDDEREGRVLLFDILSTYRGPDESSVALANALADQTKDLTFSSFAPLDALLWRIERSRHLGTAHLFLGPNGMKRLGLSRHHLPWYPLVIFGYNCVRGGLHKTIPGLEAWSAARGLEARRRLIEAHWRACRDT